jgi:alginate O-acetyltransferase complex protein AlgI
MLFTSFNFLIFFPILVSLFWMIPSRYQQLFLLTASYLFYINIKPVFVLLIAGVTYSTWFFTTIIDKTEVDIYKQRYMTLNIILVLLPLFFFKYFNNFNIGVTSFLELYHIRWPMPEIKMILPIGISYYTFVAIGYTIDVYNEEVKAEKNIVLVALFLSFFPLILSGPIERAKNMLPQFKAIRIFNPVFLVSGLKMMLWGYFMKLVVADRLGIYVDAIYNNIDHHNGTSLLFASILYPFQVYSDLGGYSLIAIGTAKILGIDVIQNFKRPFFATSMAEFWRRWHISLISWLTDYVYTPLVYSFRKYKYGSVVIALMITFLISGIWHGAALTFVVWGLLQGVYLSIEALTNRKKTKIEKKYNLKKKWWYIMISILITFTLFTTSLIFSRAASIGDAVNIYSKIFFNKGNLFIGSPTTLIFGLFGLLLLFTKDFMDEYMPNKFPLFNSQNIIIRFSSYYAIIIIILLIGVFDGGQFIYFQF